MKALVYRGPRDAQIDDKPRPSIQHPEDIILHVTSTALCGSDLHLYHGTVPGMEAGQTLGHEFMGIAEEVGPEEEESPLRLLKDILQNRIVQKKLIIDKSN